MPLFNRYIGIDYSGAATAESSLKEIRVYAATPPAEPEEVLPSSGPRKYWSRRALAGWLLEQLSSGVSAIVGIDHAFSFPMAYFERHGLPLDWPRFLNEFQSHCPTDEANTYVDFVREGMEGCWSKMAGDPSWLRLCEESGESIKNPKCQLVLSSVDNNKSLLLLCWEHGKRRRPGFRDP